MHVQTGTTAASIASWLLAARRRTAPWGNSSVQQAPSFRPPAADFGTPAPYPTRRRGPKKRRLGAIILLVSTIDTSYLGTGWTRRPQPRRKTSSLVRGAVFFSHLSHQWELPDSRGPFLAGSLAQDYCAKLHNFHALVLGRSSFLIFWSSPFSQQSIDLGLRTYMLRGIQRPERRFRCSLRLRWSWVNGGPGRR
ncbi:hypothetical protein BS50DRAFT_57148 [Corynespora cassiicola Philippines]|uniref:Uncharacterized protein n=1 Tax=Corynespora cassiicola Philippines TaxID=1448308 RepID=A0A2T2NJ13_CORCC|nr:hypothetical protein BS50DRAFT_57148 [Corynespora cassiicola Philippines]